MKRFLIHLWIYLLLFVAALANIDLTGEIVSVQEAIQNGDVARQTASLERLDRRIAQFVSPLGDTSTLNNSSAEKAHRLHQLFLALEPIKPTLITFVKQSDGYRRALATDLFKYVSPDESVRDALIELTLQRDPADDISARAYDILFKRRMDTPEVRKNLLEKLEKGDFNGPFLQALSLWRVEEAKPFFLRMLKSENPALVQRAAEGLQELGKDATDTLPALQQAIGHAKERGADPRVLYALENATLRIGQGNMGGPRASTATLRLDGKQAGHAQSTLAQWSPFVICLGALFTLALLAAVGVTLRRYLASSQDRSDDRNTSNAADSINDKPSSK